jgi:hypothetical protein
MIQFNLEENEEISIIGLEIGFFNLWNATSTPTSTIVICMPFNIILQEDVNLLVPIGAVCSATKHAWVAAVCNRCRC